MMTKLDELITAGKYYKTDVIVQWISSFFDSRHKKSLKFGRGTIPSEIIFARITQGCG
jgi:hypothetical protein